MEIFTVTWWWSIRERYNNKHCKCLITLCNSNVFKCSGSQNCWTSCITLDICPHSLKVVIFSNIHFENCFAPMQEIFKVFKQPCIDSWFAFSFCSTVCIFVLYFAPKFSIFHWRAMDYREHTCWIHLGYVLIMIHLFFSFFCCSIKVMYELIKVNDNFHWLEWR